MKEFINRTNRKRLGHTANIHKRSHNLGLVCLTMMLILLSACSNSSTSGSATRVYSADSTCSLRIPGGWKVVSEPNLANNFGGSELIFEAIMGKSGIFDNFYENIMIEKIIFDTVINLDTFAAGIIAYNSSFYPEFRTLEGEEITLDFQKALSSLSTHKLHDPICIKVLQFFIVQETIGYYIVCSTECDQYEKHESVFRSIVTSIKFN